MTAATSCFQSVLAEPDKHFYTVTVPYRRVLVVDDNEDFAEYAALIVKECGFDVEIARNGKEGLECFCRETPAGLITDLRMPVMSGQELIQWIRQSHNSNVPIVVVSAALTADFCHELSQLAVTCVEKPVSRRVFKEAIKRFRPS